MRTATIAGRFAEVGLGVVTRAGNCATRRGPMRTSRPLRSTADQGRGRLRPEDLGEEGLHRLPGALVRGLLVGGALRRVVSRGGVGERVDGAAVVDQLPVD